MTEGEYDVVFGFRNLGGNLMFLSANNFFWRTVISHNHMTRSPSGATLAGPKPP